LSPKIQNPAINGIEIEPVSGSIVTLNPGANLNAAVSQNPPGTTFLIKSGVYREQQILTQPNDSFFGETGTVLNGSELLTSFTQSGNVWVVYGQTQQGPRLGDCGSGTPLCIYPEDLYVDNAVVPRAASLAALQSGQWYFDYGSATIYLAMNPAGHVVETGVTQSAFAGVAGNITICGFTVEKYANASQIGAIGDVVPGPNWVIYNNEVELNHSTGIIVQAQSQVWQNYIHNNGMGGIFGSGAGIFVGGNEIAWNNYAGYDPILVGGGKFLQTQGLTATWNYVHDNVSAGLWTDTDNINTLFDSNTLINNAYVGIQHEISYAAVIRNNRLKGNGGAPNWVWYPQILIMNSQNVQVYNNTVMATATNGNGITIISQLRGSGAYGYYISINNAIYNNNISYQAGSTGITGIACDYSPDLPTVANAANNTFNWNNYHSSTPANYLFWFNYVNLYTWSAWQAAGEDLNSTLDTAVPALFTVMSSWTGQWE